MIIALNSGASAVSAQQKAFDIIANNVANVDTTGYKEDRADFADLIYSPARSDVATSRAPLVGNGIRVAGASTIFNQGSLIQTNRTLDLAIDGDGFFQVTMPDGSRAYTRDGSFRMDADGNLVTSNGQIVDPPVQIPKGSDLSITDDGRILVKQPGQNGVRQIGQLILAAFVNPEGLNKLGDNLYLPTQNSGQPVIGRPATWNFGSIRSGFLESSNVDLANAMTNMIEAQRAYQVNARVISNADQMLGIANNLRR